MLLYDQIYIQIEFNKQIIRRYIRVLSHYPDANYLYKVRMNRTAPIALQLLAFRKVCDEKKILIFNCTKFIY